MDIFEGGDALFSLTQRGYFKISDHFVFCTKTAKFISFTQHFPLNHHYMQENIVKIKMYEQNDNGVSGQLHSKIIVLLWVQYFLKIIYTINLQFNFHTSEM